jgi:hypothetical protein
MDPLTSLTVAAKVAQLADFSGSLVSRSVELYRSSEGALADLMDIETATHRLLQLSDKIQHDPATVYDKELQELCSSCRKAAEEMLCGLDRLKLQGKPTRWRSVTNAVRSSWRKGDMMKLARRLDRLREELTLHMLANQRCVVRPM